MFWIFSELFWIYFECILSMFRIYLPKISNLTSPEEWLNINLFKSTEVGDFPWRIRYFLPTEYPWSYKKFYVIIFLNQSFVDNKLAPWKSAISVPILRFHRISMKILYSAEVGYSPRKICNLLPNTPFPRNQYKNSPWRIVAFF